MQDEITADDLKGKTYQIGEQTSAQAGLELDGGSPTFSGAAVTRPNQIVIEPVKVSLESTQHLIEIHRTMGGMIDAITAQCPSDYHARKAMAIIYRAFAEAIAVANEKEDIEI